MNENLKDKELVLYAPYPSDDTDADVMDEMEIRCEDEDVDYDLVGEQEFLEEVAVSLQTEIEFYDDCEEYLKSLIEEYKIEVVITYEKNNKHLDGLIYKQKTLDEYIDLFDTIELVVISNPKSIIIADFTGWHYKDVIKYAGENSINIHFEYITILFPKDYVVGQSVLAGTKVLKNSNPITIYLAKEN